MSYQSQGISAPKRTKMNTQAKVLVCLLILFVIFAYSVAFFRSSRLRFTLRLGVNFRPPIQVTARGAYRDSTAAQRSLDLAATNFLLETGNSAINDLWYGNSTSFVKSFVKQAKRTINELDVDDYFYSLGIKDEMCKKRILCDLFQTLSSQKNYKARFALWAINHHMPKLRSAAEEMFICDQGIPNCETKYPGSCSMTLSPFLNFLK